MSLVFRASTNVYFSGNNHILKFFIKGLPSSFFFNSENLLSSIDQCTGNFIQPFKTRWQVIILLHLHMKEITRKRTVYIFSFYSFFKLTFFLLSLLLLSSSSLLLLLYCLNFLLYFQNKEIFCSCV